MNGAVAHGYDDVVSRRITQRELRNDSGRIMRALDKGKAFVVTRNGVPVGELIPLRQRAFVPSEVVVAAFAGAPAQMASVRGLKWEYNQRLE